MNHFQPEQLSPLDDRQSERLVSQNTSTKKGLILISPLMPIFSTGLKALLIEQNYPVEMLCRNDFSSASISQLLAKQELRNGVLFLDWNSMQILESNCSESCSSELARVFRRSILVTSQDELTRFGDRKIPTQITRRISPCQEFSVYAQAIDAVFLGHSFIDEILSEQNDSVDTKLTTRQIEVLKLIGEGLTNKEIGEALDISKRTAEKHRANMKSVLNVSSTVELVLLAKQMNLIA